MKLHWFANALLVAVAFALARVDRAQRDERERARRDALVVERLFPTEAAGERPVAGLELELPGHAPLTYVRSGGRWRCWSAFGAPVHEDEVAGLIATFHSLEGLRRADASRAPAFGFTHGEVLRARLLGPELMQRDDRDPLRVLEFGGFDPDARFGFARALDDSSNSPILEVPTPWAAALSWPAERSLPPLVDDRLLAGSWSAGRPEWTRLFLDHAGGEAVELRAREDVDPRSVERWQLFVDGAAAAPDALLPYRVVGYLTFLVRARYRGLADPRQAAALGLEVPLGRVTLVGTAGDPVVLVVGRSTPNGHFALNEANGCLVQLADDARLLVPNAAMLTDRGTANPWERWLVR